MAKDKWYIDRENVFAACITKGWCLHGQKRGLRLLSLPRWRWRFACKFGLWLASGNLRFQEGSHHAPNTVYAEHQLSFWGWNSGLCQAEGAMTSPRETLGTDCLWSFPSEHSLTCLSHWMSVTPLRKDPGCPWLTPPDFTPRTFLLGCFYLFTVILGLFPANLWDWEWPVGPSTHPNPQGASKK